MTKISLFVHIDKNTGREYTKNMENQALIKDLRSVGLPEKAAIVYSAVLELGMAFPSKIAEITKLNRSTTYKTLADLSVRGLVSQIEHRKKICYQIEKPAQLVNFAKNQIGAAEERFERAKKLLPDIEGLFALTPNKPRVRFFEGMEGVRTVYEDHVHEKESYEMLSYSNVEELMKLLPEKFVKDYVAKKERLGITTRAIFPNTEFNLSYNKEIYTEAPKSILVQSRFISPDTFPFKADVTMYGKNKVSIINFHEKILIGVIIEDPTIAGMMRMIFELAWHGVREQRAVEGDE